MRKREPEWPGLVLIVLLLLIMSAVFWYRDSMMMQACVASGKSTERCAELLR